jgi:peptidoglycan/LPS O-acetylase OafA/YrhL
VLTPGGVLYRFFQLSLMRWIGRISYGAYIIHDVLHDAYAYVVVHGSAKLIRITSGLLFLQTYQSELIPLFSLIASLCLAWLSFRFYESRFLDLKERWTIRS